MNNQTRHHPLLGIAGEMIDRALSEKIKEEKSILRKLEQLEAKIDLLLLPEHIRNEVINKQIQITPKGLRLKDE
jgi:superfamily II DNA helicase RecQ